MFSFMIVAAITLSLHTTTSLRQKIKTMCVCISERLSENQPWSFTVFGSRIGSVSTFGFFFLGKYCLDTVCKNVRKVLPGLECSQWQEVVRHWLLAHWGMQLSPGTLGSLADLETKHHCYLHQMRTHHACEDSPPSPHLQREPQVTQGLETPRLTRTAVFKEVV